MTADYAQAEAQKKLADATVKLAEATVEAAQIQAHAMVTAALIAVGPSRSDYMAKDAASAADRALGF